MIRVKTTGTFARGGHRAVRIVLDETETLVEQVAEVAESAWKNRVRVRTGAFKRDITAGPAKRRGSTVKATVSTPTMSEGRELAMEYGARGVPGTHAAERAAITAGDVAEGLAEEAAGRIARRLGGASR
jgi:hypothetical protein